MISTNKKYLKPFFKLYPEIGLFYSRDNVHHRNVNYDIVNIEIPWHIDNHFSAKWFSIDSSLHYNYIVKYSHGESIRFKILDNVKREDVLQTVKKIYEEVYKEQ